MSQHRRWIVRHHDLRASSELETALPDDCSGIFMVLWCGARPLGQLMLDRSLCESSLHTRQHLIAAAIAPAVAAISQARDAQQQPSLELALAEIELEPEPLTADVTIAICTRERSESLAQCVASIDRLRMRPREIIVVDNAPLRGATRALVEAHGGLRYVLESRPGLDFARNAAVRHATGEIVAFVDDDATVHPAWLAGLARGFADPAVAAVTGLVLPKALDTRAQFVFETEWGFNRGYLPRSFDHSFYESTRSRGTPAWLVGAGTNMAFRRAVFGSLGGFDTRLDAGASGVAGDSEYWYRILAAGGVCRYEPSAVVVHDHRREVVSLERQIYSYMRGHTSALLVQYERYGDIGNLRRLLLDLPKYYLRRAARALISGDGERRRLVRTELVGCVSGIAYHLATRAQAASSVPHFPEIAETE